MNKLKKLAIAATAVATFATFTTPNKALASDYSMPSYVEPITSNGVYAWNDGNNENWIYLTSSKFLVDNKNAKNVLTKSKTQKIKVSGRFQIHDTKNPTMAYNIKNLKVRAVLYYSPYSDDNGEIVAVKSTTVKTDKNGKFVATISTKKVPKIAKTAESRLNVKIETLQSDGKTWGGQHVTYSNQWGVNETYSFKYKK